MTKKIYIGLLVLVSFSIFAKDKIFYTSIENCTNDYVRYSGRNMKREDAQSQCLGL